jgi:16S rRNA (guanine966-N2)-methyltransferase
VTRIVGGRFGGRRLTTPAGALTRPTAEKVRAALANSLASTGGLDGARVLDLYAGSGALALELVSRGARSAVLVDHDRAAVAAARVNVAALGVVGVEILAGDVLAAAGRAYAEPFDVVVADPPYDLPDADIAAALSALHAAGNLVPGADLAVERGVRSGEFVWAEPFVGLRAKRYGDTVLCYGRAP